MSAEELRPEWRRLPFKEIAESITERVDDPSAAGVDRYVGLEHLDPESTRIRRWGSPDDVASTKLRFYPGDVVYGRRRAYQRKLGVADFEGICSAHALVLRAKPETCLPEFLPYFLQSDAFHERAVGISVGSLSPTINWKTLAKEEFALPPLDEQARIVGLMSQVDESRDRYAIAARSAVELANATMEAFFARQSESETFPLADCCSSPISYGIVQPGPVVADGVPFVNVEDMTSGRLDLAALPRTSPEISQRHSRTLLEQGDVIVALRGPIGLASVVGQTLSGANLSRGVARLSLRPELEAPFVRACFRTSVVQRQILRMQTGSTFSELKIGALRQIRIPVPSGPVQRRLVDQVEGALGVSARCEDIAAAARPLRAALLASSLEETLA